MEVYMARKNEILNKAKARDYDIHCLIDDNNAVQQNKLINFISNDTLIEELFAKITKDCQRNDSFIYANENEFLLEILEKYFDNNRYDVNEVIKYNFRTIPSYDYKNLPARSFLLNTLCRGYFTGINEEEVKKFCELDKEEQEEIADSKETTKAELQFYRFLHPVYLNIKDVYTLVEYLLQNGANVNRADSNGETPLSYALQIPILDDLTDTQKEEIIAYKTKLITLLINHKAKVKITVTNNHYNNANLVQIARHFDCSDEIIALFIKKGVKDLPATQEMFAVEKDEDEDEDSFMEWGDSGMVRYRNKIKIPYSFDTTPYEKRSPVVTKQDLVNINPLDAYKDEFQNFVCNMKSDNPFMNLLQDIVFCDDVDVKSRLDELIASGYDFNAPIIDNYLCSDEDNNTYFCHKTYPIHMIARGYIRCIDEDEFLSLHDESDVRFHLVEICNLENFGGMDYVENKLYAFMEDEKLNNKKRMILFNYVVNHTDKINVKDSAGYTAVDRAVRSHSYEILDALLDHGGVYNNYIPDFFSKNYEWTEDYSEKIPPQEPSIQKMLQLMDSKLVKKLIKAGMDVNIEDSTNHNFLTRYLNHIIYYEPGSFGLDIKFNKKFVKDLMDLGFDIKTPRCYTLLMSAIQQKDAKMVEYIIELGGTTDIPPQFSEKYPSIWKFAKNHRAGNEIYTILEQHGLGNP